MKKPTIDIIDRRTLYDKWARLIEYDLHYLSGRVDAEITRVVFDSGDGAAVLLYDPDQRTVILVRQFRFGAHFGGADDAMILEVCAGIVEDNDPRQTALREALEETGYEISSVEHVATVYATPGAHTEMLYLYVGRYQKGDKKNAGGGLDEEHEDIEVIEFTYDDLEILLREHKIRDAKTLILVQHWYIHLYQ